MLLYYEKFIAVNGITCHYKRSIMGKITYNPIGVIHSTFKDIKGMPIQPTGAKGIAGTIEIKPEYVDGLQDIEGFSHIILIYHFHLSKGYSLKVKPFLDENLRGVFATRAPRRPNHIGISVVKLVKVEGAILHIEDIDIVDGTSLLDIKPYVPEFDVHEVERTGWLSKKVKKVHEVKADKRFQE
jgi:tRNA-Thr(GGU) m(6)t(6)A37 methyltransferase TsaA